MTALVVSRTISEESWKRVSFRPSPKYDRKVDFGASLTFSTKGMTPAYLRQAGRDLSAHLAQIAEEMETTVPEAHA